MQIAAIIMRKFDEYIDQLLSFSADIISTHSDWLLRAAPS